MADPPKETSPTTSDDNIGNKQANGTHSVQFHTLNSFGLVVKSFCHCVLCLGAEK